jgi:hypothetical protein
MPGKLIDELEHRAGTKAVEMLDPPLAVQMRYFLRLSDG